MEESNPEEIIENDDYPFDSWDTFFNAFEESLNTEFFSETYPEYSKIVKKQGNLFIIDNLIKNYNLNVSEGLYKYIYSLCYTGTRYGEDAYEKDIVDYFIEKGAKFPSDLLFDDAKDIFNSDIDSECYSYRVRASIIEDFSHLLNPFKYIDWNKIEAEHIEHQDIGDTFDYDLVRFKHLKSLSSYLQNL